MDIHMDIHRDTHMNIYMDTHIGIHMEIYMGYKQGYLCVLRDVEFHNRIRTDIHLSYGYLDNEYIHKIMNIHVYMVDI